MKKKITYAAGILEAFEYLLENHKEFFVIGQGLWSPWYVGSTMKDLDKKYGKERVIDCPVSELATTGSPNVIYANSNIIYTFWQSGTIVY